MAFIYHAVIVDVPFVFFFDENPSRTDGRVGIRRRRGDEVDWNFFAVLHLGGGFWGQASSNSHQSCKRR